MSRRTPFAKFVFPHLDLPGTWHRYKPRPAVGWKEYNRIRKSNPTDTRINE